MGNILSCLFRCPSQRRRSQRRPEISIESINLDSRSGVGHRSVNNINFVFDESPTNDDPTNSDLVIGIDFGTTFTGAAYACTANIGKAASLGEMRRVADKISVIKTWPNQTNNYTEKTPSILAYNRDPPAWGGGNVKPTDEPRVAYFKLGLQDDVTTLYQHHSSQPRNEDSVLGGYLSDSTWTHPELPEMKSINYAADFLSCINRYIKEEALSHRYGDRFLQNQNLSYVLTVPAIWSDKAKELTQTAAVTAGIKRENLTLITEPEAAAIYCATLCNDMDLEPGDRFMICDAGGGTVVCFQQITVG